jgi:hypothetical protein
MRRISCLIYAWTFFFNYLKYKEKLAGVNFNIVAWRGQSVIKLLKWASSLVSCKKSMNYTYALYYSLFFLVMHSASFPSRLASTVSDRSQNTNRKFKVIPKAYPLASNSWSFGRFFQEYKLHFWGIIYNQNILVTFESIHSYFFVICFI